MKRVLQAKQNFWYGQLSELASNRQLLKSILGFINHLLYIAAKRHKYIGRLGNGRVSIRRKFIDIARKQIAVLTSTVGMSKYMRRHWCGSDSSRVHGGGDRAWHSRPKLLEVQKLLEGWELFRVDSPGFRQQRRPTTYHNIKLADLLIIAEVAESLLMDTAYACGKYSKKKNFATLPSHRGYFLIQCFNTIFKGIAVWRRQGDDDSILPVWDLTEQDILEWEYEYEWGLNW